MKMDIFQWTWVWASSKSWWWTRKPGVLPSMGSQRVGHNWVTFTYMWNLKRTPNLQIQRTDLWLPEAGKGKRWRNWVKEVKTYRCPVISEFWGCNVQPGDYSSLQSLSRVWFFVTLWTAAHQASLSITNSQSLLKTMSVESVIPSNYLILWHPFLLLPSIFPNIRVFSNESVLSIRWPKYQSLSFSILPMNIQDWFPLGLTGLLSRVFSNTTVTVNNTILYIWKLLRE